ncbi:MAG: phosphate ABC transporter substrate-binding protein [Desulfobacter sp.]|nr:MAG: phosphate ABC transporter substrate-binding protein [Desulfobacter sp.]
MTVSYPRPYTITCFILSLVLLVLLPLRAQGAAGKTILRIHGSNTIGAELMPDLAKQFLQQKGYQLVSREKGAKERECFIVGAKNNDIHRIEIKAHGSGTGFAGLKSGACDIAMASRRIKEKEAKALAPKGDMTSIRNEHILAVDGIALILNPSNRIKALALDQISHIFSGRITNWADVGGQNRPITVYALDNQSGTYDTFKQMVLKNNTLVKTAKRYDSNAGLSKGVTRDANGIGFVSMAGVLGAKALSIKEHKGTSAVEATNLSVACEDYPLSRRLYLYAPARNDNPLIREFIDYALSEEGQTRVAMKGFAKLSMDMGDIEITAPRFKDPSHNQRYKNETLGGRRINFNFRFTGAGSLDNRSQKDLERLARYIQQPSQQYYELVLIGLNACSQAHGVGTTIINRIGADRFYVPPRIVCLDNVATPAGKSWSPVIEVWLRTVDDGA